MIEIEDKEIQLPHNDVTDYSNEFVELYRRQPSWIVKWGIAVISISFFLLLFLTFYIKYPDISGKARLTSSNPPSVVIVRSEGLLTEIEASDGAKVIKGQVIASIKNTVDLNNYKKLKSTLKIIERLDPSEYVNLQLGELQQYYNDFLLQLKNAQLKGRLAQYKNKSTKYSGDIVNLEKTIKRQQHKKELYLEELKLGEKDLTRSRTLFAKGVISQKELDDKEQQFTSLQRTFEDFDMELFKLQMQLSEIDNSSELLKIDSSENLDLQNETSRNARKALEEKIKEWENKVPRLRYQYLIFISHLNSIFANLLP